VGGDKPRLEALVCGQDRLQIREIAAHPIIWQTVRASLATGAMLKF